MTVPPSATLRLFGDAASLSDSRFFIFPRNFQLELHPYRWVVTFRPDPLHDGAVSGGVWSRARLLSWRTRTGVEEACGPVAVGHDVCGGLADGQGLARGLLRRERDVIEVLVEGELDGEVERVATSRDARSGRGARWRSHSSARLEASEDT